MSDTRSTVYDSNSKIKITGQYVSDSVTGKEGWPLGASKFQLSVSVDPAICEPVRAPAQVSTPVT